jgi:2,3,4,5-tetrahydropyridine-2-carboxylate N-succinyltransferase
MNKNISNAWDLWQKNKDLKEILLIKDEINQTIELLDSGKQRVCEKINNEWFVNQEVKLAIIMYFLLSSNQTSKSYQDFLGEVSWYDKIGSKLANWNKEDFEQSKFRVIPGAYIRKGAYIGKNTVIMPSFINIGAYIDDNTMIDSMTTIGSCAQIGKNCHISAQVCIGGVLEPAQAKPVIIGDNCFIGAGSQITEGVTLEDNSVIASGVILTAGTKIVDRQSGNISYGNIPKGAVVVPGSIKTNEDISLSCAVIVKYVDGVTRSKTSINEILRQ